MDILKLQLANGSKGYTICLYKLTDNKKIKQKIKWLWKSFKVMYVKKRKEKIVGILGKGDKNMTKIGFL